jgi:hypothetical protein
VFCQVENKQRLGKMNWNGKLYPLNKVFKGGAIQSSHFKECPHFMYVRQKLVRFYFSGATFANQVLRILKN